MALPETRFAKAGDLSIAYQVLGDGDVDVILVPQWLSNIEQYWENAAASYFLRRIASFSRLICFDKRGTGLSDPVPATQTLEERMDDVLSPGLAREEACRHWWGRFERHSVRPGMVKPIFETINELDIRAVLPAIRVPTLVLHRAGDRLIDVSNARYLAEHIPGARYVELAGDDHIYFAGDADGLLDEIE